MMRRQGEALGERVKGETIMTASRGTWVAQSVKHLTLDFSSGHDLTVREFKPCIGLHAGRAEPAWDSLFLPFFVPPQLTVSFSK